MRLQSKELALQVGSALDHPTAKGDKRERLLRSFLQNRLGSMVGSTKGEIVDSRGVSSQGEYDLIAFSNEPGASIATDDERQLVRVEDVIFTTEIKSELKSEHLEEAFSKQNKELVQLSRFYAALPSLKPLLMLKDKLSGEASAQTMDKLTKAGVGSWEDFESIPAIPNFFFAYKAPTIETVQKYLQFPCVDAICALGSYTVSKQGLGLTSQTSGDVILWGEGDDALGAFVHLVERSIDAHRGARMWVRPLWERYFHSPELHRREADKATR